MILADWNTTTLHGITSRVSSHCQLVSGARAPQTRLHSMCIHTCASKLLTCFALSWKREPTLAARAEVKGAGRDTRRAPAARYMAHKIHQLLSCMVIGVNWALWLPQGRVLCCNSYLDQPSGRAGGSQHRHFHQFEVVCSNKVKCM